MLLKTVRVTNPSNVLVQIPGYVVATWGLDTESRLEVDFNEKTNEITIRPCLYGRASFSKRSTEVARTTAT